MKAQLFALTLSAAALALAGCSAGTSESLLPGGVNEKATSPESTAAEDNTWHHPTQLAELDNGGEYSLRSFNVSAPEAAARLHGCTKVPYGTLRTILESRGANLGGDQPDSAGVLYRDGRGALGAPNYGARSPELLFGTTASMAKQFDISVAAAGDVVANFGGSRGCQGVTLVEDNQLTKAGISCLMGKPAKDEHLTLANDLVAKADNPQDGVRLAVAALLSAAHTCE